ncbi:MAG: aminoacyl--tRNA ligase-related protein [Patescibacteria group bacterium]
MKQSQLFSKTRKEAPKDEVSRNAQLLIRAGYINKELAGVYSLLPLGVLTLGRINQIIREEMNAIGGQEVLLSTLQEKGLWQKTNRWDDKVVDIWFKTKLKNDTELGLGFTHEEPLTMLMKNFVQSFRDLPVYPYQIQTKFRNEIRAKSGIMRGREFLMKDLYSFSRDEKEHTAFYEKTKQAYTNVFRRMGLGERTFLTFASGGSFAKYSHEFQTVTDAGEDFIYVDEKSGIAVNKEVLTDEVLADLGLKREVLVEKKAVEVGNIFNLGTRFSEPLELRFLNEKGEKQNVVMGSYGIGPTRLMGTIVEVLADADGIVWPDSVAPFRVHLIAIADKAGRVADEATKLYNALTEKGIDVLYDDRDARPGEKFADSDLLGLPHRVVISEKTLAEGVVEYKPRRANAAGERPVEKIAQAELLKRLAK